MSYPNTKQTLMSLAVASACGLIAMPASAQAPVTRVVEQDVIPEVKVTATRYSTSLLRTPIAVTAYSQDNLTRLGITSAKDIANDIPNVNIQETNDAAIQITIRGITSTNTTETGDPAVGFHIDGMYSPRPQGAQALMFDVEQVEVLRGPQGTLFGRNSTAGSVNVISAKPDWLGNYGKVEVDLGNYNKRQINMVQNVVVNDKLALRASFMKVKRDGYINQLQDFSEGNAPAHGWIPDGVPDLDQRWNRKVDKSDFYTNQDQYAMRLAARFKATKDLTFSAAYELFQDNGAGGTNLRDCDATKGTRWACQRGENDLLINVPGAMDMTIQSLRGKAEWNISNNTGIDYMFMVADQRRSQQFDQDKGLSHAYPFQITADYPNRPDANNWGTWPLVDSYQATLDSKYLSHVQELQLKQQFGGLRYVAGLFWMHEKNQINYEVVQHFRQPHGLGSGTLYNQPDRQVDAKAVFAQADWDFLPKWTATAGARYSVDTKTDRGGLVYGGWAGTNAFYNGDFNGGEPNTPGYRFPSGNDYTYRMGFNVANYGLYPKATSNDHSEEWKKVTWRLGLQHQVTENQMAYASLSTGYKAGGFGDKVDSCNNQGCADGSKSFDTFLVYQPELVTNLELGYKGKFFDNTMNLAVTGFFMKYKDQQLTGNYFVNKIKTADGLPCPAGNLACDSFSTWRTINVGNTRVSGLEVEWDYKPWKGAKVGGALAYLNTDIRDYGPYNDNYACAERVEFNAPACPAAFTGAGPLNGQNLYDVTGNNLPNAPKLTFQFNLSQAFVLDGGYKVTPFLKVNWRDKVYFTVRNEDWARIGRYQKAAAMGDASVRLDSPESTWHAEAYVRNITNERYKYNGNTATGGAMLASYNEPRMFGVRAGFNY